MAKFGLNRSGRAEVGKVKEYGEVLGKWKNKCGWMKWREMKLERQKEG